MNSIEFNNLIILNYILIDYIITKKKLNNEIERKKLNNKKKV
jgi:hypothetical protein